MVWNAQQIVRTILRSMEHPDPLHALHNLATESATAGPISHVALALENSTSIMLYGPVPCQKQASKANVESLKNSVLPDHPTCIVDPKEKCGFGLDTAPEAITFIPLRTQERTLGAVILAHPYEHVPSNAFLRDPSLGTLGSHVATGLVLRQSFDRAKETLPSLWPANTEDLRAISMVGRAASLGKVAGGLVHEVNNPSTFITLAGAQIGRLASRDEISEVETSGIMEMVKGIQESTQQIVGVVTAFRLLASATNKQTVVSVDLDQVLQSAVALTRAAHRHDAVIETDFCLMPPCPGCFAQLGPVLIDILLNAIESFDSNGDSKTIRVQTRLKEEMVQVRVRDTGKGIAQEVLSRVFDPLFTTKNTNDHAGLGLTVARQTLACFGGVISIESEVEKGTEVLLQAPICQPPADFTPHD